MAKRLRYDPNQTYSEAASPTPPLRDHGPSTYGQICDLIQTVEKLSERVEQQSKLIEKLTELAERQIGRLDRIEKTLLPDKHEHHHRKPRPPSWSST